MSELERLIQELCPNGVEFKKISDICDISRGKVMSKDYIKENAGEYPVYSSQTEHNGELGKISSYVYDGEYLTWTTDGANAGTVFYRTGKFSVTNVCGLLKVNTPLLNVKFLYYALFGEAPKHVSSGMGNPKLMSNVMAKIKIPVPPIEVQDEIVRILDNFTELTAELTEKLTEELTARKTQYEYYRDELLALPDISRIPLSKLTLKVDSINWKKHEGTMKYIDLSSVDRGAHRIIDDEVLEVSAVNAPSRAKQIVKENDILFGGTRPMLKRYCIVPYEYDEQVCSTGYCVLRVNDKIALTNFVYHCLGTSEFYRYVEANQQGTSYPAIGDTVLKAYEIPIPSLEEQGRIAAVLDRFDILYNDISEGLLVEIEARQKKYEYYRDKLLKFKEMSV